MPPAILAGQGSAVAQDTSQRQIRRCRRRDRQRTTVATTIRPCRRCRKRRSNRPGKPPCQSPKWSNLHSAWRQRNGQTTRDFLHWRFSDAGNPREPSQTPCNGVRETCTLFAVSHIIENGLSASQFRMISMAADALQQSHKQ